VAAAQCNDKSAKNGKGGGKGKPTGVGQDIDLSDPSSWGRQVSDDQYECNLGNGNKVITDVFWVR
jgi:hypothetical protein